MTEVFGSKPRSALRIVMAMVGVSILCMAVFVLTADELCHRDIVKRQPIYPNATVIESQHDFIRTRAIGNSRMTLFTTDDIETVQAWMRETRLRLLNEGVSLSGGLAMVRWDAEADGDGSLIYLYSECGT